MKRETLKEQTNKDGSHTRIEKITQTPEDGFVSNKEHRADWEYPGHDVGMFERGHFKGHKTTVTYWRTHTKKTRVWLFVGFIIAAIVFSVIFKIVISFQDTPETVAEIKLYWAGTVLFIGFCFVKSLLIFRKQDRQEQQEREEDQQTKNT